MTQRTLLKIVENIDDLPTLPAVVMRILSMLEDPSNTALQVSKVMSHDPTLALKCLKLVNSSFYGSPNRISSIQQAITMLGFNTVRSLAISATVVDVFKSGNKTFDYNAFFKYSVYCAVVSSSIAKQLKCYNADTAFVTGLLHGIGKMVYDQYLPEELMLAREKAIEEKKNLHEVEAEFLPFSYAETGALLLEYWQIACDVITNVQYQHMPEKAPPSSQVMCSILLLARYLCREKGIQNSCDYGENTINPFALQTLKINPSQLSQLQINLETAYTNAQEFLSLIIT